MEKHHDRVRKLTQAHEKETIKYMLKARLRSKVLKAIIPSEKAQLQTSRGSISGKTAED